MNIKNWKQFNETYATGDMDKDLWWDENYEELINIASSISYEDWVSILDGDEDMALAIMDSTGKHKAHTLLSIYNLDELEDLINEEDEDEEDDL